MTKTLFLLMLLLPPFLEEEEEDESPGHGVTPLSPVNRCPLVAIGSPSSRSEHAMATPTSDNTFLRFNHFDIHADDVATQDTDGSIF